MTKKQRAIFAVNALKERYPAECSLCAGDPLQLLIATRLSAQCTDARVNLVTPALFARFKTAAEFAAAEISEVEGLIKSCGLYKTKARDIVLMCRAICERFGGGVPESMEDLTSLPGIGRKTANLIRGDVYGLPAVVTDTHLIRVSNRLGLCATEDPVKVERELIKLIPPDESSDFCHRVVLFGRDICSARAPKCGTCPLAECCAAV
ncbi:MAG: endonuclease III [Oscillospiraceae bacterium]|jgi:endonuclease-3|nr:endonuclease III [Oscillospiraceae bacterium]